MDNKLYQNGLRIQNLLENWGGRLELGHNYYFLQKKSHALTVFTILTWAVLRIQTKGLPRFHIIIILQQGKTLY